MFPLLINEIIINFHLIVCDTCLTDSLCVWCKHSPRYTHTQSL